MGGGQFTECHVFTEGQKPWCNPRKGTAQGLSNLLLSNLKQILSTAYLCVQTNWFRLGGEVAVGNSYAKEGWIVWPMGIMEMTLLICIIYLVFVTHCEGPETPLINPW